MTANFISLPHHTVFVEQVDGLILDENLVIEVHQKRFISIKLFYKQKGVYFGFNNRQQFRDLKLNVK